MAQKSAGAVCISRINVESEVANPMAAIATELRAGRHRQDGTQQPVSSGVVDFKVDAYAPKVVRVDVPAVDPKPKSKAASALEILLDGVEARIKSR